MKYKNIVHKVSNYATDELNRVLNSYGQAGFRLVNVIMAENKYDINVMYLFFTKEMVSEDRKEDEGK